MPNSSNYKKSRDPKKMPTQNITKELLKQAEASEHKEAYQNIYKTEHNRVGVGVRLLSTTAPTPTFFIEIIINMCPTCTKANLQYMQKALDCLKKLEENSYTLTCQEDNNILCEKTIKQKDLQAASRTAKIILEKSQQ